MKVKHLYLIKKSYLDLANAVLHHSSDEFSHYFYLLGARNFATGNDKKLLELIIDVYVNGSKDSFLNFDFSKYSYDLR